MKNSWILRINNFYISREQNSQKMNMQSVECSPNTQMQTTSKLLHQIVTASLKGLKIHNVVPSFFFPPFTSYFQEYEFTFNIHECSRNTENFVAREECPCAINARKLRGHKLRCEIRDESIDRNRARPALSSRDSGERARIIRVNT